MRYPQVYVFFKPGTAVSISDIQSVCDSETKIELFAAGAQINSASGKRVELAIKIAQSLSNEYLRPSTCAVINTSELSSFFTLKYSGAIQATVWMTTFEDFLRLRSGLAIFNNYWLLVRGLDLCVRHYARVSKVLGNQCPEFKQDPSLFSDLAMYGRSLDTSAIFESMRKRLKSVSHFGKYAI